MNVPNVCEAAKQAIFEKKAKKLASFGKWLLL
jgi:hypothetical protein